jgi:hypothetical protein
MRAHGWVWLAAALVVGACTLPAAHAFTWQACDADKVPFVPDTVHLVPDPPAAGGQVTFNIQGNAGAVPGRCHRVRR